jgi:hypothetical protein
LSLRSLSPSRSSSSCGFFLSILDPMGNVSPLLLLLVGFVVHQSVFGLLALLFNQASPPADLVRSIATPKIQTLILMHACGPFRPLSSLSYNPLSPNKTSVQKV